MSDWISKNMLLYVVVVVLVTMLVLYFLSQSENAVSASMVKATFAGTLKNKLADKMTRDDGMTLVDLALEDKFIEGT